MKYIDSEKLIAEITKMQFELNAAYRQPQSNIIVRAISLEYDDVISLVNSLQQEQPMPDSHKGSWIEETKKELQHEEELLDMRLETLKRIREKKNQFQQEQSEVGLERFDKDVTKIWCRCAAEPNDSIACLHIETFNEVARHFYELGLKARKEK